MENLRQELVANLDIIMTYRTPDKLSMETLIEDLFQPGTLVKRYNDDNTFGVVVSKVVYYNDSTLRCTYVLWSKFNNDYL